MLNIPFSEKYKFNKKYIILIFVFIIIGFILNRYEDKNNLKVKEYNLKSKILKNSDTINGVLTDFFIEDYTIFLTIDDSLFYKTFTYIDINSEKINKLKIGIRLEKSLKNDTLYLIEKQECKNIFLIVD